MRFKINLDNGELDSIYFLSKDTAFFKSLKNASEKETEELNKIFSKEEIKESYLFENIKPNKFLKYKYINSLGKRYIITFTDKKYVSKFKKYGFKIIKENIKGKWFYGICMRKDLNDR